MNEFLHTLYTYDSAHVKRKPNVHDDISGSESVAASNCHKG